MPLSTRRILADLKRRHVFRVASVYGAAGFVILQVADILADSLELPAVVMKAAIFLALVGFPIALVLAWALEASPDGLRKAQPATEGELETILAE
jgi:ABC-type Fe3+-siderophore transport system permease subunit